METRTVRQLLLAAAASLAIISSATAADSYPVKPVRMIVGFPPGGFVDVAACPPR